MQEPAGATRMGRVARLRVRSARLSRAGTVLAVAWLVIAGTPSLLPRPWWLQGLVAALSAVCGYVLGLALGSLVKAAGRWLGFHAGVDPRRGRLVQRAVLGLLVLFGLLFPFLTIEWQRTVATHVGLRAPGWGYPVGASLVTLVVFGLVLLLWRGIARLLRFFLSRVSSHVLREGVARLVASALTLVTVVLVVDLLVQPAVMAVIGGNADRVNREVPSGATAPTSPLRSGGPGSPHTWGSLGQDGASFVSRGPDAAAISRVTGRPAKEPVRVFVGVGAPIEQTADAVIRELDRTHAWERRAVLVETATSTGYINLWGAASFEYLQDGDTAIASMAYSDLPSAFGLLTAGDDPPTAGRVLLDKVRARVAALPPHRRPKVYVSGESLGAYGADTAFASVDEMLERVDGAVFSGTPTFARNRRTLTRDRAEGSTSIVPVVEDGRHVRFAGAPDQLLADEYGHRLGRWEHPRVVYLQHPSDPVAWWSPELLFSSPEWLRETRRGTAMAQMSWTPVVTFWQVSADMLVSNDVPGGFGHRYYGAEMVPAWAAVLGVDPGDRLDAIVDAVGR